MQYVINGNVLVFTDQHFGIKNNSIARLEVLEHVFDEICREITARNIQHVISCGDLFHSRNALDVNTINTAYKCIVKLSQLAHVWLIVGNHDSYLKNSIDINSLVMFDQIQNVTIIHKTTEVSINRNRSLLVPWLGDISTYTAETFDMLFGHFEASRQYLIQSYVEEHSGNNRTTTGASALIAENPLLQTVKSSTAGDAIGNFVDLVKKNTGIVFSGHIHQHKELTSKGRKFIFVGTPNQQTFNEKDNVSGFYVIDSANQIEFVEIHDTPKHKEILMSRAIDPDFDFRCVKGNIIRKIYDIEVSREDDAKVSQKINDMKPFEELTPEYEVNITDVQIAEQNEMIKLIRKSKLEYVKNYIDRIDKSVLEEQNLDSEKLYAVMENYYNLVTEN